MKTIDPAPSIRREAASPLRLLCVAACLVCVALATAAQQVAPPTGSPDVLPGLTSEEAVWITVGADAWEALLDGAAFRYGGLPLAEIDREADIVLTRVRAADLPAISEFLHGALERCAGFMRHTDLADARQALARRAEPLVRGPQAYSIDQGAAVQELMDALHKPNLLETIERLSTDYNNRYHQHPSGVAAAQWIRDQWEGYAAGREDVTVDLFPHPGINQPSVVLTIQGASLRDEVVVLGGHLDSTSNAGSSNPDFLAPGADDNASGIAVLAEVVRAAMEIGFQPKRTVSFMGYAAEEIGLVGSHDIAAEYAAAGVDVVAVLQLDMTGYMGSPEDIFLFSDNTDPVLTGFVADLVDTYQPELVWTSSACGYPCSDHASWHQEGYPAAFSFEARFGDHNPEIHRVTDTLATLGNSVDHAHKFARLAAGFLVETAKAFDVVFEDGFESGDTTAWSATVP